MELLEQPLFSGCTATIHPNSRIHEVWLHHVAPVAPKDCFNELAVRLDDLSRQLEPPTAEPAAPVSMTPTAEKVAYLRRSPRDGERDRDGGFICFLLCSFIKIMI